MGADESGCSSLEYTFLEEKLVSAISKGMRKQGGRKKAIRRRVIPLKGSFGETAGARQNIYIIKKNCCNNQPKRFTSQLKII